MYNKDEPLHMDRTNGTRTEEVVVKALSRSNYPRGSTILFKNTQGILMKAKKTKHSIVIKNANTNVRATVSYNIAKTRKIEMKVSDYMHMKAVEMRAELKSRGLNASGTKSAMNARLIEDDSRGEEE